MAHCPLPHLSCSLPNPIHPTTSQPVLFREAERRLRSASLTSASPKRLGRRASVQICRGIRERKGDRGHTWGAAVSGHRAAAGHGAHWGSRERAGSPGRGDAMTARGATQDAPALAEASLRGLGGESLTIGIGLGIEALTAAPVVAQQGHFPFLPLRAKPKPRNLRTERRQLSGRKRPTVGPGDCRLPETAGPASGTFANFPVAQARDGGEEAEEATGVLTLTAAPRWIGLKRVFTGSCGEPDVCR